MNETLHYQTLFDYNDYAYVIGPCIHNIEENIYGIHSDKMSCAVVWIPFGMVKLIITNAI